MAGLPPQVATRFPRKVFSADSAMGDQGRWFKLWCSAPSDPALQALLPALRWAWAALGCYTKVHGSNGVLVMNGSNPVLAAEMGVPSEALLDTIKQLPHVHLEEGQPVNGKHTVTFSHWRKYQEDSTVADRVRKWRADKVKRDKRRREEKRREPPLSSPPHPPGFETFWTAYPKKVGKDDALRCWSKRRCERLTGDILASLHKQLAWLTREEGRYIPNPATWLNQGRWKDEPPPSTASPSYHRPLAKE